MSLLDIALIAAVLSSGSLAWCWARGVYNGHQNNLYWQERNRREDEQYAYQAQIRTLIHRLDTLHNQNWLYLVGCPGPVPHGPIYRRMLSLPPVWWRSGGYAWVTQ